jgi:hypothetical protein
MLKQDFQIKKLLTPCPFGLDCGKWTGQNYENKIALPIGTDKQQPPLVKEQCYIINSLFENKTK